MRGADARDRGHRLGRPSSGATSRRVRRATPPGLANPVAVFACSFVSPMPTAQCSPVSVEHRRLDRAGRGASGSAVRAPTKASSQPHSSTGAPERSQRGHHLVPTPRRRRGGPTAGTRRRGTGAAPSRSGMPERTPNARASYDAVATTWRGRVGSPSPPTTTGRPAQLGSAQHLDGGQELVQVDVQHPVALARRHRAHRRSNRHPRQSATPSRGSSWNVAEFVPRSAPPARGPLPAVHAPSAGPPRAWLARTSCSMAQVKGAATHRGRPGKPVGEASRLWRVSPTSSQLLTNPSVNLLSSGGFRLPVRGRPPAVGMATPSTSLRLVAPWPFPADLPRHLGQ